MTFPHETIQKMLDNIVSGNKTIPGAILSVCSHDKSISWTGCSGYTTLQKQTPITPKTPFFTTGITKMITTAAIFILIDRGMLDLDDPAGRHIPSTLFHGLHTFKQHDYTPRITIRHLLNHTSGIANYFTGKPKKRLSFIESAQEEPKKTWSPTEAILYVQKHLKPEFPPGTKCHYSDTNFQLLGIIIESITNDTLENFFHKEIFEPLRMDNSWFYHKSEPLKPSLEPIHPYLNDTDFTSINAMRSAWADGGVIATADDCLKFYRAFTEERIFSLKNLHQSQKWLKILPCTLYRFGRMKFRIFLPLQPFFGFSNLIGHIGTTGSFLLKAEGYDLYMTGSFNQYRYAFLQINTLARIASKIIQSKAIKKDS